MRAALSLLLLLTAGAAHGQDFATTAVGTAGSEFLNVDVDARAIAMGGAFTAASDNAYAMYWNPAGLSMISRAAAGAMHNEYISGVRFEYLSYAARVADQQVIGGSFRYMDTGNINRTDISGNDLGKFHPRSYVVEAGIGRNIPDLTDSERDVSIGVALRYFRTTIVESASGVSGDFGIQLHYTESFAPYNFGFVVQNFGRGQKFDRNRDSLPTQMKLGASVRPRPAVLLVMDAVLPVSNQPYLALGSEFGVSAKDDLDVFFRLGYSMRTLVSNLQGFRGVRMGLGAKAREFTFDYTWSPLGQLGNTHQFSLSWALPTKRSRSYRRR